VPPEFIQVDSSSLFVMPRGPGDAGWSAYLVVKGKAPPKDPITVREGLSQDGAVSGHFLFAPVQPPLSTGEEVDRFVNAVWDYIANTFSAGSTAFVWIPDPRSPSHGAIAFTYLRQGNFIAVQSGFKAKLGAQMSLLIASRVFLTPTADEDGVRFQSGGQIGFETQPLGHAPQIGPSGLQLPCVGPYTGCFLFDGNLMPYSNTLSFFETGIRYCHPAATQIYPVIETEIAEQISYTAAFDPLDPVNAGPNVDRKTGRIRTLFAPIDIAGGPAVFDSWLRTATGLATKLMPLGGSTREAPPAARAGAFVFERSGKADDAASPVYMSFAGDWGILVGDGAPSAYELLCGIDGLERVSFRSSTSGTAGDRLRFVPGCPAYAPRFPFTNASITHPVGPEELLDGTHRTSWMAMVQGDAEKIEYLAQPSSSPLYRVDDSDVSETSVWSWYRTAADLPQEPGFATPLVPYGGIEKAPQRFPTGQIVSFETEVLSPARKALIAPPALARLRAAKAARLRGAGDEPVATATTPQGFVVSLSGSSYMRVTLARSSGPDFAFIDVTPELQNLLQTNQLFGVIVDPKYVGTPSPPLPGSPALLGAPQFENAVNMSGWKLRADVGNGSTPTSYRNVVIFKFCEGTLRERVATPDRWTDPKQFSVLAADGDSHDPVRLSGLSQWLRGYIEAAIAEHDAGNHLYDDFYAAATEPSWNGILVLQAEVADVPPELNGIMAGVDPKQLTAHHFGVTVTPVKAGAAGPDVGTSSLFGLIDYQVPIYRQNVRGGAGPDTPVPLPVEGAYGFTVLQLQALFRNAALVDFRSRVQLTIKELFGSRVDVAYGITGRAPATAVVLRGSYQNQSGKDAYVFEQAATTVLTLDDDVLQAVAFDRVQLDSLGQIGSGSNALTASRFLIWGKLNFAALADREGEPFDVLSFGSAAGVAGEKLDEGLAFSNLKIDMTAPVATPNATSFAFDASGIAFDLATSNLRDDSLFQSLALQLDSFLTAPAGRRPAEYGYLPVTSDLRLAAFDGPWYAISHKLTMGTPGALVATAGFESRLLVGWSPQPKKTTGSPTYAVVTGIQLPGAAPGAKLLSLQGILKLSIDSIRLLRQQVAGHPGKKAFVLQLRNVGLKFLGIAKLPPGATINFFVFGSLQGSGSLGWYAAYRKDSGDEGLAALEPGRVPAEILP